MTADEAHRDRLIEAAAKAHSKSVALNMASALRCLYSPDHPTPSEAAEIAGAEAAAAAADEAVAKCRSDTHRRT